MSEFDVVTSAFDGDWTTFATRHWARRPVLFKGVTTAPFVEDEVFRAAARAAGVGDTPAIPPATQFTIERQRQLNGGAYLPEPADMSFDAYQKRVDGLLDGRRYALTISVLHAFDQPMWARERAFYAGLWDRVGLPLTGAITTLFHGTYEHSPVGVHLDHFATFMYVLKGSKRMRFWPRRPWGDHVTTVLDYKPYLDQSFAATAEAGDLLYWPSFYYHVGESAGSEPATSVNIGVPWDRHGARADLDDLLVDVRAEDMSPTETFGALPDVGAAMFARGAGPSGVLTTTLPTALHRATRVIEARGDERRGRERVTLRSMRRLTAGGFEPVPEPAAPPELDDEVMLRGDAAFPVLWTRDVGRGCVCAVNGHAVRTTVGPARLSRVLDRLNTGAPQRVGELLRGFRSTAATVDEVVPASRQGMRELLRRLESFGGVTRM